MAFFPGFHNLSALFTGSDALFGSLSKSTPLLIRTPKLKPAADGFARATIHAGHGGATVKAGQTVTVSYTGFLQGNAAVFDYANAQYAREFDFYGSGVARVLRDSGFRSWRAGDEGRGDSRGGHSVGIGIWPWWSWKHPAERRFAVPGQASIDHVAAFRKPRS